MIWIDLETYNELNLKNVGLYRYVEHPSLELMCMAWAVDDGPVKLWKPGNLWPVPTDTGVNLVAHNAEFELRVLQKLINPKLRPSQFTDTMALAGWFGYPLGLDGFAQAVGAEVLKDPSGKRAMLSLCKPRKPTKTNRATRWTYDMAPEKYEKMYSYVQDDVRAMRAATKKLPIQQLSHEELVVWAHTLERNRRGLQVDIELVDAIISKLEEYKTKLEGELVYITGGRVRTGKQVAKMQEFLKSEGVRLPNLRAETVSLALESTPGVAHRVLELRQALAHSSVAKFYKMKEMICRDGRIRGNEQYYGAHTGRFAGRGVQIHNLPRAKFNDPDKAAFDFLNNDLDWLMVEYGDVNRAAKKLVRPAVIPAPGNDFIVGDYSSIENRVLHWSAEDTKTIQEFEQGLDQYKTFAADRFRIMYEEVTHKQRQFSKPCVLGLGYGAGAKALQAYAAGYGIILDLIDAQREVDFYRKKYRKVVKYWYNLHDKAILAITCGDVERLRIWGSHLKFIYAGGYLYITLPSGRFISYPGAKVSPGPYNRPQVSYMGVDPYTRQWVRRHIHPGGLAENITQAISRDILTYGILAAEKQKFYMVGTVHDEGISEVAKGDRSVDEFCAALCVKPEWTKGLPLSAEGYRGSRYKKD